MGRRHVVNLVVPDDAERIVLPDSVLADATRTFHRQRRDLDARPPDEVARRLHISTRNVAVRLHRAHELLRPRLLRRIAGAEAGRFAEKKL